MTNKMKRLEHPGVLSILPAVLLMLLCGCNSLDVHNYSKKGASRFASLHMNADIPEGGSKAAKAIREDMLHLIYNEMSLFSDNEEEKGYGDYEGDRRRTDDVLEYYRKETLKALSAITEADCEMRNAYIMALPGLTDEQKQAQISQYPTWIYDYSFTKLSESGKYYVILSENKMFCGGRNTFLTGKGIIIYDIRNAHRLEYTVLRSATAELQPAITEAFLRHYAQQGLEMDKEQLMNSHLFLEEDFIPLPHWSPYPTKDGMVFTYRHGEIAPSGEGAVSITIPYREIKPFLTEEARSLLGM